MTEWDQWQEAAETDPLAAAHDYVRRGWRVVPLYGATDDGCRCRAGSMCPPKNRGKHPHGKGGNWRILSTGAEVQEWFEANPHDNLGVVTGPESGLFVFDVDGAPGVASLAEMVNERGAMPATRIVRTGSGGLHYYFRTPGHFVVHNSAGWLGKGIDIRGAGGQVVAPPSRSGLGEYEVIADHEVAEAPAWLLEMLAEHARHVEDGRRAEVIAAERVDVELIPPEIENLRRHMLKDGEGRHRHFHAIVAACFEARFTQGQAVTIVAPWCVAVGKFVGRVEAEVARSWAKIESSAEKAEEWLPGSTVLGAPEGEAPGADAQTPAAPAESAADGDSEDLGAESGDDIAATWAPVDLTAILEGTYVPVEPELMPRTDEVCLLYAGLVHSFHGESESGKSLLAQAAAAEVLSWGGSVAYVDFESDAGSVVGRLLEMGATAGPLSERFAYLRPDVDPRRFPHEREHFAALLGREWDLIIIDGVTDALGVFGAGTNDNDEITAWMRAFPRLLARRTGAAVVLIDHVTKDSDSRGRFAVGGQAKMNALDGAAYTIEVASALGRGLCGTIVMKVAKDRPGGVRPHAGQWHKDRTQEAARVTVDSSGGDGIVVTVGPPNVGAAGAANVADPRPLEDMERVSRALEGQETGRPNAWIRPLAGIKNQRMVEALAFLEKAGHVRDEGKGNGHAWVLLKPFSAVDDYVAQAATVPTVPDRSRTVPDPAKSTVPTPPSPYGVGNGDGAPENASTVPDRSRCERCDRDVEPILWHRWQNHCPACARQLGLAPDD